MESELPTLTCSCTVGAPSLNMVAGLKDIYRSATSSTFLLGTAERTKETVICEGDCKRQARPWRKVGKGRGESKEGSSVGVGKGRGMK